MFLLPVQRILIRVSFKLTWLSKLLKINLQDLGELREKTLKAGKPRSSEGNCITSFTSNYRKVGKCNHSDIASILSKPFANDW